LPDAFSPESVVVAISYGSSNIDPSSQKYEWAKVLPVTAAESTSPEQKLKQQLEELKRANLALTIKVAKFERAANRGGEASARDQEKIKTLETEREALQQEVAQLKQTVASQKGELLIEDLSLKAEQAPRSFAYSMTVKRTIMDGSKLVGELKVNLSGTENGAAKQYDLEQLTAEGQSEHRLGFMYFQTITGVLQLPELFTPESIVIDIAAENDGVGPYHEQFEWSSIVVEATTSGT